MRRGYKGSNHTALRKAKIVCLTLLHSKRPKLYAILAFPGAIGLSYQQDSDQTEQMPGLI